MKVLNAYSKFLDVLTKILRAILIILLASMVIIMIYNVICRYIFSDAKPWAEELTLISLFSASCWAWALPAAATATCRWTS